MLAADEVMPTAPARRALLDAAVELTAEGGATSVGLTAIRKRAGVSVGATYHHFADRQALLDSAWLDCLADYQHGFLAALAEAGAHVPTGLAAGIEHHLRWHIEQVARARVLRVSGLPSPRPQAAAARMELNRPFFRTTRAWWKAGVASGALLDVPFDLAHALWLGPAQSLCDQWLTDVRRMPPTMHVRTLIRATVATLVPVIDPRTHVAN